MLRHLIQMIPPEDLAELQAFKPIAGLIGAAWTIGTLVSNAVLPHDFPLTREQQWLLVAGMTLSLAIAAITHHDNRKAGVYQR